MVVMKRMALTMILDIPIPLTPKFAENGNVDIRKVPKIRQRTNFTPVKTYTYLSFPNITKPTRANL